jgi:hypothetical protein
MVKQKIRRITRFTHRKLVNRPVTAVLALLVLIYLCATALIMISEQKLRSARPPPGSCLPFWVN